MGGGRHIPSHSSGPAISNAPGAPTAAGATSVVQTSSSVSGKALPKPAPVPTAPLQPPPMIYYEICKIECNSPEIMEQHKNGKRHKKNMKAHEELQRRNVINGQQSEQLSTSQLNLADQPKNVQKSEKKECPTENLGSEITANNHKDVIELQNNVGETSEVPAEEPEGKTTDNPN
ncbi:Zinc finger C2H2 superfamily [Sesbania bispinosa]|nr:Zinc finger C2H2 superfamily [Sesbania bispinosa]